MAKYTILGAGALVLCCLSSAACSGESSEDVSRHQDALSGDFTDASGKVTIRIKTCGWTSPAESNTATCTVDTDFILVGGGAEIEFQNSPGALLTGSFPDSNLSTWTASSKAHVVSYPHKLRAYAVGLKLAGVSSTTLRSRGVLADDGRTMLPYVWLTSEQSSTADHPSVTAELDSHYNLIGGGAQANGLASAGQLLTRSYPDSFQWVAESKDHVVKDVNWVKAFAIGITKGTIPGFGSLDVAVNSAITFQTSGGQYGVAQLLAPTGSVASCVGGDSSYDRATGGRLLTDLIPFFDVPSNTRQGAFVTDKDHVVSDTGSTRAYVISVRKH